MAGQDTISVLCECGKKLKAPATSIGRRARCPACKATVLLNPPKAPLASPFGVANSPSQARKSSAPASPPPLPVKPARLPQDDDGLSALYELADQATSAPAPVEGARCPQCQSGMDDDAVICMNCGYNARAGKSVAMAKAAAPAKSSSLEFGGKTKKPLDYMAPQGSLVAGIALSAAFAVAASLVWVAVAWATGFTIGYIAILIGGAAGLGMRIGQKGFSTAGGGIAAGMTLVAILAAKVAVIELLLSRQGIDRSIFDLDGAKLGLYFLSPIGLIIMVIGMGAAYRTANGSSGT